MAFCGETQTVQQFACTCRGIIAAQLIQQLMRFGHGIIIFGIHGIGFGTDDIVYRLIAAQNEIQGRIRQRWRFLSNTGDAQTRWHVDIALIGIYLAQYGGE